MAGGWESPEIMFIHVLRSDASGRQSVGKPTHDFTRGLCVGSCALSAPKHMLEDTVFPYMVVLGCLPAV